MLRSRLAALILVVLSVIGFGCGESIQPTLEVAPDSGTLVTGNEGQLTVTRRFPGGQVDDVTSRVEYTSSNRNVLGVSATGKLIPGTEGGSAVIRVDDPKSEAFATAVFTVVPPRVESIDVIPSPALVMAPFDRRQFEARGRFSDGVTRVITGNVQWSSSNEAAALVGRTAADHGLVAAVAPGDAIIVARDSATGVEGRTTVFVRGSGPQLVAVVVEPNPATVAVGGIQQFAALGVYADGSSTAITTEVQWSSGDDATLAIDGNGLATGVKAGSTAVTAFVNSAQVRASAAVKVQ
jgi:trimeric autotransporter adhesin